MSALIGFAQQDSVGPYKDILSDIECYINSLNMWWNIHLQKNFKKQTILTHQKKTFEHHKKRENSKVFVVDTHHEKVWSHSLWHREDHTHFLLGILRYFFDTQHIQKS